MVLMHLVINDRGNHWFEWKNLLSFGIPRLGDCVDRIFLKFNNPFFKQEDVWAFIEAIHVYIHRKNVRTRVLFFSSELLHILHMINRKKKNGEIEIPIFPLYLDMLRFCRLNVTIQFAKDIECNSLNSLERKDVIQSVHSILAGVPGDICELILAYAKDVTNIFDVMLNYKYFKYHYKYVTREHQMFPYMFWIEIEVPKTCIDKDGIVTFACGHRFMHEFWFLFKEKPFHYLAHEGNPRVTVDLPHVISSNELTKMEGVTIPVYVLSLPPTPNVKATIFTSNNILKNSTLMVIGKWQHRVRYRWGEGFVSCNL